MDFSLGVGHVPYSWWLKALELVKDVPRQGYTFQLPTIIPIGTAAVVLETEIALTWIQFWFKIEISRLWLGEIWQSLLPLSRTPSNEVSTLIFEFTALLYFPCLKSSNKKLQFVSQLFEEVFGEDGVRGPWAVIKELRIVHETTRIAQELFPWFSYPLGKYKIFFRVISKVYPATPRSLSVGGLQFQCQHMASCFERVCLAFFIDINFKSYGRLPSIVISSNYPLACSTHQWL